MATRGKSLAYELRQGAYKGITTDTSKQNYSRAVKDFTSWAKAEGIKRFDMVDIAVIQRYSDYLQGHPKGYSANTIHAKLAPICKATDVTMDRIKKPKRINANNSRGRTGTVRADNDLNNPKYETLVKVQKMVGIRADELKDLTGADLSANGQWLTVRRGKGGKATEQYILPEHRALITAIFEPIEPTAKVFDDKLIDNTHINLHGIRAMHAQAVYAHFADRLSEDADGTLRADLQADLIRRWDKAHQREMVAYRANYERERTKFINEITNTKAYVIRGANARKAQELGLPTSYDRLALMATSVYALSHWRNNVTVGNYMLYRMDIDMTV